MSYRTQGELNEIAKRFADEIRSTDIEQRGTLYDLIATQLRFHNQSHQASLFERIAKVA